jgi:spore germination cell wall hydrolase CwlJ-like protein
MYANASILDTPAVAALQVYGTRPSAIPVRGWRAWVMLLLASWMATDAHAGYNVAERPKPEGTYLQRAVAAILVAEAGCDKQRGMIGVAEVIRNRAREKKKSPVAIIKQPGVFSSLIDTDLDAMIRKQSSHPQFASALRIARMLLNEPERLPNTTRNATHFDNVNNSPYWTLTAKATVTIGSHRFYRTSY